MTPRHDTSQYFIQDCGKYGLVITPRRGKRQSVCAQGELEQELRAMIGMDEQELNLMIRHNCFY